MRALVCTQIGGEEFLEVQDVSSPPCAPAQVRVALAAEHMTAGGVVINVSSKASLHPSPFTVVYAAAKAGLNALTRAAAQELAPRGIRVNAIVCGTFHTDSFHASAPTPEIQAEVAARVALGRIADAGEIVGTALYLASDASSYLTGELITLDGG